MQKSDKTKLELIRLEGIRKLIWKKLKKEEIAEICKNKLHMDSKDYNELLNKLSREKLIKIIEYSKSINSDDIQFAFEQFRYGLKPGFVIFNYLKNNDDTNIDYVKRVAETELQYTVSVGDEKYKELKLKNCSDISNNTTEFAFAYLSKHTYIDENEEPKFVYEMNDCFAWVNLNNKFVAIKNCPNEIQNQLSKIFSKGLSSELYNIRITRPLIKAVFSGKVKKGTYINLNANDDEVTKITVADENLTDKKMYNDVLSNYDVSSTFLDEPIDETTTSKLGINCKAGKIYLTRNLDATQFRAWSVSSINKITNYLNDINNCREADVFKSRNILANTQYSASCKEIIEDICYKILLHSYNNATSFLLKKDVTEIYESLSKNFYYCFFGTCEICNEETQLVCKNCHSSNLKIVKNNLFCQNCGESIASLICDEGHNVYYNNISEILKLIPNKEFLEEVKKLLFTNFSINFDGFFTIENHHLNIHEYTNGELIKPSEILEFSDILSAEIDEVKFNENFIKYDKIKEKCSNSRNINCQTCNGLKNNCIMQLFTGFGDYRPSPHQGHEFGDVNFEVTLQNGQKKNFVGIVKCKPKSGILNFASSSSREMIQQIITISRDKNVEIIGAICPAKFHDQLRQDLRYIANITKIKIVILDDYFMCKLLMKKQNINK